MPFKIETRVNNKWTTLSTPFDTYHSAVLCGQDIAPLNFSVITTRNHTPTREEQLLLPPERPKFFGRAARKTKVDKWLESI